ncbi:MAG: V-type ATP synthase subunit E family protein [Candidatus Omnitrophota bacterium]
MALEDIIKKILEDAQNKAQEILTRAEQEAEQIRKEADVKAERVAQEIIQENTNSGQQEALRITTLARLEARKEILSAKQKILNKIFSDPNISGLVKAEKTVVLPETEKRETLEPEIYLNTVRPNYEARVAEILFEKQ